MVEIVKNDSGEYQLHFKSTTGITLLRSNSFDNKSDAEVMLHQVTTKPIFERKTNHQGKFVIALKTENGQSIGTSNTYSSEAGMENGIKNLLKSLSNG